MQGNKLMFAVDSPSGNRATTTYQGIVSDKGITGWVLTDVSAKRNRVERKAGDSRSRQGPAAPRCTAPTAGVGATGT